MSLKNKLATKIKIHGFSVNAYDVIQGRNETGLAIPINLNKFFRELIPVSSILSFILTISLGITLIPFVALGYYLVSQQMDLFWNAQIPVLERLSSATGAIISIAAGIYVIFFHLPLPFRKNVKQIRWGFLYHLSPHPSDQGKFDRWLGR